MNIWKDDVVFVHVSKDMNIYQNITWQQAVLLKPTDMNRLLLSDLKLCIKKDAYAPTTI